MGTRLNLLTIMVNDMAVMLPFYRDTLGFAVKRDRGGWVSLENDGTRLALWERTSLRQQFPSVEFPTCLNGSFVLAICYESLEILEREHARIISGGDVVEMSPVKAAPQWDMWSSWIADPEGNILELTYHDN